MVIWNIDLGYEHGSYSIPNTDKGTYQSLLFGSRLGLNLFGLFLGFYGKVGQPFFKSENNSPVDRLNNPLPEDSSTSWGVSMGLHLNSVQLYYSFLSESYKYEDKVNPTDSRNLYYRYEGSGYEVGLGTKIFKEVFLTYHYHYRSLTEQKQKVDGVFTELQSRANPLKIKSHVIGFRFPVDLSKLPSFFADLVK